jgi:hypothetical protein
MDRDECGDLAVSHERPKTKRVRGCLNSPISALLVREKSSFTLSKLRFFPSSRLDLDEFRQPLKL